MDLKEIGLSKKAKSLLFRRRMSEFIYIIEDEIRDYLLNNGKDEIIAGGFKISVREGGQVEVIELPPLDLEQMDLPLKGNPESKG